MNGLTKIIKSILDKQENKNPLIKVRLEPNHDIYGVFYSGSKLVLRHLGIKTPELVDTNSYTTKHLVSYFDKPINPTTLGELINTYSNFVEEYSEEGTPLLVVPRDTFEIEKKYSLDHEVIGYRLILIRPYEYKLVSEFSNSYNESEPANQEPAFINIMPSGFK